MRVLLDTHVLLRLLADTGGASRDLKAIVNRSDTHVSVASIWEISIKASLGKLKANPAEVLQSLDPSGFSLLAVQGSHAARVYDLGRHHHDPFDRLLVAQAQLESMLLLTYDEALAAYGDSVRVL
jgi:PIN domain nuclease of toxin-antitoxin system